jgi:hypothetical protein
MQLKFFAKGDLLVSKPGFLPRFAGGDVPRYIGRSFVPRDGDKPAHHIATKEPYACEANSEEGRRLAFLTRRDACLWPADAETAAACGVKFVSTEFKDGEHVAKPTKPPKE